jgi:hypothetical protein
MTHLTEELYTKKECKILKELLDEDKTLSHAVLTAVGSKIIIDSEKILLSNPLDIIYTLCLMAKFASSEEECYRIAITVFHHMTLTKDVLPYMIDEEGLALANKTLISLSFYFPALEKRWKMQGAPSPSFYREMSKSIFRQHGQCDIADHHEQWEEFLCEFFV